MTTLSFINEEVHKLYWKDNLNCATTTIKVLGKIFDFKPTPQVINSAIGLNGAGRYGAQCGLVEGVLISIGIIGKNNNLPNKFIIKQCHNFAKNFEKTFGSLLCRKLRPQGFSKNNPPNLCEKITKKALMFSVKFIEKNVGAKSKNDWIKNKSAGWHPTQKCDLWVLCFFDHCFCFPAL